MCFRNEKNFCKMDTNKNIIKQLKLVPSKHKLPTMKKYTAAVEIKVDPLSWAHMTPTRRFICSERKLFLCFRVSSNLVNNF